MANPQQGEIRVGASHQAQLPACNPGHIDQTQDNAWETSAWKGAKAISDPNLLTYLQAARSIAAFAGICDRGHSEDMLEAVQSDATTLHAMNVLHESDYDTNKALQYLVKCQPPKNVDRKWCEEDQVIESHSLLKYRHSFKTRYSYIFFFF